MTAQERYDKVMQRLESLRNSNKGGLTETAEKQRAVLVKQMLQLQEHLIATGQWAGPIPMKSKAKYRPAA